MKKLKYLLGFSIIVFILTSIHLGYQYIVFSSDKISSKWGTVIEGTSQGITYLPYLSVSKSDKWYQHLLYRGCIVMWSGNQLTGDICTVTTDDNKTYKLSLNSDWEWSDGTSITINDVFFTYYDVIKSNQRSMPFLNSYSKLEITQNNDGTIDVVFPRESVDNQLFFLNPILPAHHLTNQKLQYYQHQFASNPVTSACATLKPQTTDKDSVIFDLTNCDEYTPQILQVKQFDSNTWLQSYMQKNPKLIDYVIDGQDSHLTQYGIASTQAIISYFHVNTISDSTRRQLALLFNNVLNLKETDLPWFIPYEGMFDIAGTVDRNTIKRNLWLIKITAPIPTSGEVVSGIIASWTVSDPTIKIDTNETPILTKNILAYGTNKYKTAYLPAQSEKFTILFKFDEAYDKIAIAANGPYKYFPESYKPETKTAEYNLSTAFNNLAIGKNTYTIRWYKWDQAATLLTLTIYYIKKPTNPAKTTTNTTEVVTNLDGTRTIRIVYVKHPVIDTFVDQLKMVLWWNQMSDNFIFSSVENVSKLEEVVSSKAYEVIIKPMDLGTRNDLSILVHDDPMINNAQYKNQTLKNNLADLNQSSRSIQSKIIKSIQEIYYKDTPFMILGNTMEYIGIADHISWAPATDTSIDNVRDQLLNHIRPIYSLNIDKQLLLSPTHLFKFLIGSNAK